MPNPLSKSRALPHGTPDLALWAELRAGRPTQSSGARPGRPLLRALQRHGHEIARGGQGWLRAHGIEPELTVITDVDGWPEELQEPDDDWDDADGDGGPRA